MAAAAITIVQKPATIESDTTGAVITKTDVNLCGYLNNHGPADVYAYVSIDDRDAATVADVATTNAQAQQIVPIPAGGRLPWLKIYNSVAHKTAAGTATLSWVPGM